MTHQKLVELAYNWVLKNAGCGIAFKERLTVNNSGEIPDVIGFGTWGHSVVIEAKCSRADFLRDKKKKFRQNPELGMGKHRFFICPRDLIKIEELPENWGLIYVYESGKCKRVHNPYGGNVNRFRSGFKDRNIQAEHSYMYSMLRRLKDHKVLDKIYERVELN